MRSTNTKTKGKLNLNFFDRAHQGLYYKQPICSQSEALCTESWKVFAVRLAILPAIESLESKTRNGPRKPKSDPKKS